MTDLATLSAAVDALMPRVRDDLGALVAIPSVYDAAVQPIAECERAAEWVRAAFEASGIDDVRLQETPDGSLAVLGRRAGPEGAPTVLLYSHYDVQPSLGEDLWQTPPFELVECDGRWYGRGAADCKGNLVAHLTALRALRDEDGGYPVGLIVVVEGSEEQGGGGLEEYVSAHPGEFADADVVLVMDSGNAAPGEPTITSTLRGTANLTVRMRSLEGNVHSGSYGGAAPDALVALVAMLASLRNADGDLTVDGIDASAVWDGVAYPEERFRADAGLLPGTQVVGSSDIATQQWARPTITIIGIDAPAVAGSVPAVQASAAARLNLRVPAGVDTDAAQVALTAHIRAHTPWGVHVEIQTEATGPGFRARTDGPAYQALAESLAEAYGTARTGSMGNGGSIPLCTAFQAANPAAEVLLFGVEEPLCLIHAPNESVNPDEIRAVAIAEALLLTRLGASV